MSAPQVELDAHGRLLPLRPPSGGSWGRWGEDDRRGAANLISAARVAAAAGLVRRGVVFSLALPIDATAPRFPLRQDHHHRLTHTGADAVAARAAGVETDPIAWNDDAIELATHGSTHWDGLGHMQVDDTLYNGFWAGNVTARDGDVALGIEHQRESFVGRGVLLDLARQLGVATLEPGFAISPELLEAACASQAVAIEEGDVLLLRTGFLGHWWTLTTEAERSAYWDGSPGVGAAGAEWIAARGVAAAAADTAGFEVLPFEDPAVPFPVHRRFLHELGITIGELWDLDRLADDCARDGVWEAFLVAPPLYLPHAVGSPMNPLAIK